MDIKNCWGMIFTERGEYSNARAMFSEVFNDSQEAEYALQRQYSLCGIGDCGLFSGDYEKADSCYRLALEIGNVSNNIFLNALCIKGIGIVLLVQGNWIKSIEYLQKSFIAVSNNRCSAIYWQGLDEHREFIPGDRRLQSFIGIQIGSP